MRLNDGVEKPGDEENELITVEEIGEDKEDRINLPASLCSKTRCH